MPVILESGTAIKRWRGFSSDTKPRFTEDGEKRSAIPPMSIFRELDTGRQYVWATDRWVLQNQTLEALLNEVNENLEILNNQNRQMVFGLSQYLGIDLSKC